MRAGFATVTTLFFMWGFITVSIDPLIAALKAIFELSYAEAMLTQFAFFMAYFVVSLPAAALIARLGNSKSIMFALGVMVLGCLIVPGRDALRHLSAGAGGAVRHRERHHHPAGGGESAGRGAGPPERSHFRLTFSQAFNSLGTCLAPKLVSGMMLAGGIFAVTHGRAKSRRAARRILREDRPAFLMIAGALVLLALFIFAFRASARRHQARRRRASGLRSLTALKSRWALFGGVAIFLYVGAEVSIGSAMTNFLHEPDMLTSRSKKPARW